MNKSERLNELVESLLSAKKDVAELTPIVKEMADILGGWTGISVEDDMNNWSDIETASGVAISPLQAAKCLKEPVRTQVFQLGIKQAIEELIASRADAEDNSEINILYAGTGPFGTILLPLLPRFREAKVKVTCLDIHPENLAAVPKVIKALNVEHMIRSIELGDATKWQPKAGIAFDLIVSETMNTFLRREPQVSIFANLQQFLTPTGKLIPENVHTSIWCRDNSEVGNDEAIHGEPITTHRAVVGTKKIADLFQLNKTTATQLAAGKTDILEFQFNLPQVAGVIDALVEITQITVYGEHHLGLDESSLCMPVTRRQFHGVAGDLVKYQYQLSTSPDWQTSLPDYFAQQPIPNKEVKSRLGICYLPRLFAHYEKLRTKHFQKEVVNEEFATIAELCARFGLTLEQLLGFFSMGYSSLEQFEAWFEQHAVDCTQEKINKFNEFVLG